MADDAPADPEFARKLEDWRTAELTRAVARYAGDYPPGRLAAIRDELRRRGVEPPPAGTAGAPAILHLALAALVALALLALAALGARSLWGILGGG